MSALNLLRIGCSDAATLAGADKYGSPFGLYARLKNLGEPERSADLDLAGEFGRSFELPIWSMFARREGLEHIQPVYNLSREHGSREFLRYTPDFLVGGDEPRNVQCKLISGRRYESENWGAEGTDEVPDRIRIQVTAEIEALKSEPDYWAEHGIDVAKITHADVAVATVEYRLQLVRYRVPYSPELGDMLREMMERFWVDHVLAGVPPEPDHTERCADVLEMLHPKHDKVVLSATAEDERLAEEMRRVCFQLSTLEQEKERLNNVLRSRIGDSRGIKGNGWSLSWTSMEAGPKKEDVTKAIAARFNVPPSDIENLINALPGKPYRKLNPRGFNKSAGGAE